MHCRSTTISLALSLLVVSACCFAADTPTLDIRPRPQIVSYRGEGFEITGKSRILIPKDWPPYISVGANEIILAIKEKTGLDIPVVEEAQMKPAAGDIAIGPHWVVRPEWVEPLAQGLVRPSRDEGYNILINERNAALMGNTERGCFQAIQTFIQIVRQTAKNDDGTFQLPGVIISDWPSHNWRTLQLHLVHTGSPFDRGEHVYRTATSARVMERAIKLATYMKMTGLVVDVESGMTYDRHPENLTTGMTRNKKEDIRKAVDLAKALGLNLVPKSNSSSGHDGWVIPYAYAARAQTSISKRCTTYTTRSSRSSGRTISMLGLDEDVFHDLDGAAAARQRPAQESSSRRLRLPPSERDHNAYVERRHHSARNGHR